MNNDTKIFAYLVRIKETDMGTEGLFLCGNKFWYSLELPYRNNQKGMSCIPEGEYLCIPYTSQKYKNIYHITNVPNRSSILIHAGTFAGDITKGLKTHIQGCILLGKTLGYINKQRAILSSKIAIQELYDHIGKNKFNLKILRGTHDN